MNPYNFALLLFAFGSFFIGLLVAFKRQDAIGRIYFLFSAVTTIWGIGFAVMLNQQISYGLALLSARIADGVASFIPTIWLHLTLLMSDRLQRRKKMLFMCYALSLIFFGFSFSPFFIAKVKPILNFKYWPHPGFLFHFFTAMFCIVIPYSFVNLYSKIKKSYGDEKVQLKGFFIAVLFGFLGGTISFALNYDIPIPQYAVFFMPTYPFVTAYFMIRYRLFDIEQIAQAFQREKLATIGLLAASVNHEIKSPLYAAKSLIDNYLEHAKEGLKPKDPIELSIKVSDQLSRVLDVITKLNRFSKSSDNQSSINRKTSIPEAIQTVLDLASYEFKHDQIKINNQIPDHLPLIQADQRQLEEILFNLIVNACHAMSASNRNSGGSAESFGGGRSGTLTLRSMIHNSRITLEISDTGPGISQDHMKHLFEPFYTTKGDKGTGLGLYITKQLVERNGGKIAVKSQEDKGASFVLEFKTS